MRRVNFIILICLSALYSCTEKQEEVFQDEVFVDPCEGYVDQVYEYPPFPENGWGENWREESIAYFTIPDSVLQCISTGNLLETCLNYPQNGLISFYGRVNGFAFIFTDYCNGYFKLVSRPDFKQAWYHKYRGMDPAINGNLDFLIMEMLCGNLINEFTGDEAFKLLQLVISKTETKEAANFRIDGRIGGYAIMARIMLENGYEPFVEFYNSGIYNIHDFVEWLHWGIHNVHLLILTYAEEYLSGYLNG